MATKSVTNGFSLEVTLDASQIEDRKADHPVQVVAQDSKGKLHAVRVVIDAKGGGAASFSFKEHPGSLRVIIGPVDATPEEMTGLQTVAVDVPTRQWANKRSLNLQPIVISPYYWNWWLRWCRKFTITGRVLCADGKPVPGASVCAYDVDWWWWWFSEQQVGCYTTAADGSFTIKFTWCCGWWPWWWWRMRHWQLELGWRSASAP